MLRLLNENSEFKEPSLQPESESALKQELRRTRNKFWLLAAASLICVATSIASVVKIAKEAASWTASKNPDSRLIGIYPKSPTEHLTLIGICGLIAAGSFWGGMRAFIESQEQETIMGNLQRSLEQRRERKNEGK